MSVYHPCESDFESAMDDDYNMAFILRLEGGLAHSRRTFVGASILMLLSNMSRLFLHWILQIHVFSYLGLSGNVKKAAVIME